MCLHKLHFKNSDPIMAELGRICQIRQKIAFEKIFPHLIEAAKQK